MLVIPSEPYATPLVILSEAQRSRKICSSRRSCLQFPEVPPDLELICKVIVDQFHRFFNRCARFGSHFPGQCGTARPASIHLLENGRFTPAYRPHGGGIDQ